MESDEAYDGDGRRGVGKLGFVGTRFRDDQGRHVILRGVNFGGDSKLPTSPDGHTYRATDFADHRTVSFVGRPAPLDQLDAHLARLRFWGFNCLRLLVTWEAVEHAGPGQYDEVYLDYIAEVCRRAGLFGLRIFIDFHQDVWSRMSGGDGAPGWTWEAAGLDFTRFDQADAAIVMQHRYDAARGGEQERYPRMIWGSNYRMPANAIIWALFWAGETFAPGHMIEGINVGRYIQDHYLGSMRAVAKRVAHLDHVIGFDTLNEPGSGWIGQRLDERRGVLRGLAWCPLDALAVASGHSRVLPLLEGGETRVNADGVSIWLPGCDDPFRAAGAWDVDEEGAPFARDPAFFVRQGDDEVDLEADYRLPFYHRVADTVRDVREDWLLFAESDPFASGEQGFPDAMPERSVNGSHWYDLGALVTKRFDPEQHVEIRSKRALAGVQAIEQSYVAGLAKLAAKGDELPGGAPSIVGECGIPYDMNGAESYRRWAAGERGPDVWRAQTVALELMYNALDRLLLSSTQWNYTVSNRNDPMVGDGWNQEDLSIWSQDQVVEGAGIGSGGRAVAGFCRPYVRAAQGNLISQRFDREGGSFEAVVELDPSVTAPTEVFVPEGQFPTGFTCDAGDAEIETRGRVVEVTARRAGTLTVRVHAFRDR